MSDFLERIKNVMDYFKRVDKDKKHSIMLEKITSVLEENKDYFSDCKEPFIVFNKNEVNAEPPSIDYFNSMKIIKFRAIFLPNDIDDSFNIKDEFDDTFEVLTYDELKELAGKEDKNNE